MEDLTASGDVMSPAHDGMADSPAAPRMRRLKALIAFRVCVVTGLLGSFIVFQIGYGKFPYSFAVMYLIAAIYGLTIIHLALLGRIQSALHAYVQVIGDVVGTMAFISLTGGIESWFSSLLILNVISAAVVLGGRAGYVVATLSAILYGALIDMQYYGVVPVPFDPNTAEKDFLFNIFSHITGLYLTAFLIGQLVMRLESQALDIKDLTAFNREVIENTPSGLFTTDAQGRIRIFNRAAERITGLSRQRALGHDASDVFTFLPRSLSWPERAEEFITTGGQRRVIGLMISTMYDSAGNESGRIGTFEDLTEIKALAAQVRRKEKLAAIGELSANIAHEIRNPLASLKSSIELIREGSVNTQQRNRLMDIATTEMDRLNAIISDFLSYARPSSPKMQPCDLHAALDHTADILSGLGRHDVIISREYKGAMQLVADPSMLQQVFLNIGLNAFDAMPQGGTLSLCTAQSGDMVEVRISDTGVGIEPQNAERVFYPFYTTKQNGTGIGLSIAYKIAVEDHGGAIYAQDNPSGRGAMFLVRLPIHQKSLQ